MSEGISAMAGAPVHDALRLVLAHGDARLRTIPPVLGHLLAREEADLFCEEVIARTRGMIAHLAAQLLAETGDATDGAVTVLAADLTAQCGLLTHVHALALEWRLTERLRCSLALEPVLSPLVQSLIASSDGETSAKAMNLLAAQARFAQSVQRMELPLTELPADLLHGALLALRTSDKADAQSEAEAGIRERFDERFTRLGLIARLVSGMGNKISAALAVEEAGVAIFLTAAALASGQERHQVVLSTTEDQAARLAVTLRAGGLEAASIAQQVIALHPDLPPLEGLDVLDPGSAAALLAVAGS